MVKFIKCGMFLVGVVLCFYPLISDKIGPQKQQMYEEGVIGIIEIPIIDLQLPIYLGTEEEILSKGIGHMDESSPLAGGENSHALLAGHRGLPNAEMFLRLNELKAGDTFVIHVSGQEFVYEVCKIQVILPEEAEVLQVQEGKDLVSLITCTPYGINTHRLVVTGERKVNNE